jgi:predicted Zn-dependent peptidase
MKNTQLTNYYLSNEIFNKYSSSFNFDDIFFTKYKEAVKTNVVISFLSNIKPTDEPVLYLKLIEEILVGDLSAYFYSILRDKEGLIYNISMDTSIDIDSLLVVFEVSTQSKNLKKLLDILSNLLEKFVSGNYPNKYFDRAK